MNITFDYFKLELPTSSVRIVNPNEFTRTISKDGAVTYLHYKQKNPFSYSVDIDVTRNSTSLSFSGKALLENYPSLINVNNIIECFENINNCQICHIDSNRALNEATVSECDVTSDIQYAGTIRQLLEALTLKNDNYTVYKKSQNRFYLQTTFVTQRKRESLVVYDKNIELNKSSNQPFLDFVLNSKEQKEYFSDKIRIELNLRSVDRIRKFFQSKDIHLSTLLNSPMDPIAIFLEQALYSEISLDSLIGYTPKLRDLEHMLLLCTCGFDLKKVERIVRQTTSKKSSITNNMRPYRILYEKMKMKGINPKIDLDFIQLQTLIQNMMSSIFSSDNIKINTSLALLYSNEREHPNQSVYNPLFYFNIPTIRLPILLE